MIEPSFASLIEGGGGLNLSQFVFFIIHIFKAEFNKHQDSDINTINMYFCFHPFCLRKWAASAREELRMHCGGHKKITLLPPKFFQLG